MVALEVIVVVVLVVTLQEVSRKEIPKINQSEHRACQRFLHHHFLYYQLIHVYGH